MSLPIDSALTWTSGVPSDCTGTAHNCGAETPDDSGNCPSGGTACATGFWWDPDRALCYPDEEWTDLEFTRNITGQLLVGLLTRACTASDNDYRLILYRFDDAQTPALDDHLIMEASGILGFSLGMRPDGTIDLLYTRSGVLSYRMSQDGGATWSERQTISLTGIYGNPVTDIGSVGHVFLPAGRQVPLLVSGLELDGGGSPQTADYLYVGTGQGPLSAFTWGGPTARTFTAEYGLAVAEDGSSWRECTAGGGSPAWVRDIQSDGTHVLDSVLDGTGQMLGAGVTNFDERLGVGAKLGIQTGTTGGGFEAEPVDIVATGFTMSSDGIHWSRSSLSSPVFDTGLQPYYRMHPAGTPSEGIVRFIARGLRLRPREDGVWELCYLPAAHTPAFGRCRGFRADGTGTWT